MTLKSLFRSVLICSFLIGATGCAISPKVIPAEFITTEISEIGDKTIIFLPTRDFRESAADGIYRQIFGRADPPYIHNRLADKGWNIEFSQDESLYVLLTASDLEILENASADGEIISDLGFLDRFDPLQENVVLITSLVTADSVGGAASTILLGFGAKAVVVGYLVDLPNSKVLLRAVGASSSRGPLLFGGGRGVSLRLAIEKSLEIITDKFPINASD